MVLAGELLAPSADSCPVQPLRQRHRRGVSLLPFHGLDFAFCKTHGSILRCGAGDGEHLIALRWHGAAIGTEHTAGQVSASSAVITATPWDWIPPARPVGVKAQPGLLAGQILILWDPVLDAEPIAGYIVRRTDGTTYELTDQGTTTSRLDSAVGNGVSGSYAVRAVDSSGNESEESVIVTAVARHSGVTAPVSLTAAFEVDPQGAPITLCDAGAENDDLLGVRLTWHRTPSTQVTFRIYRASGTGLDYTKIYEVTGSDWGASGICNSSANPMCSYFDATVTGYDHTYYVVAYANPGGGSNRESPASNTSTATTEFEVEEATVRSVGVWDKRADYNTDNSRSRTAQVYWSRAMVPELQGYHVYRRCRWQLTYTANTAYGMSNRTPNCTHSWVQLTTVPVTQNYFTDTTLGGLGGAYQYAVRPVGPEGEEGELSTVVAVELQDLSNHNSVHCEQWPYDNDINTKGSNVSEVSRINAIDRLSGPSGGEPSAPTGLSSDWAAQAHSTEMDSENTADSTYGWIKWARNEESDLAGYHVELAGSTEGPWKRMTTDPIAWWETRYDLKGMWIDQASGYVGPECVVLRVVAIDRDGLESQPSAAQQIPAGCSRTESTGPAPAVLLASTAATSGGQANLCTTRLKWPRVAGADKYYVYRFMLKNRSLYFYRTHTQLDTACGEHCEYVESGDCKGPDANPELDCPWNQTNPGPCEGVGEIDIPSCVNTSLQAFYVTAVKNDDASGYEAESPPSEIVFWDCSENPGYARREVKDADLLDLVAAVLDESPAAEELVCSAEATFGDPSEGGVSTSGQESTGALDPSVAPLLTLGQAAGNPPYGIYDLHVDHLGSTRLVTDEWGGVVSYHSFYPFGEEVADFDYDEYNTKLFTGHERDEETGLDYMLARYYSAPIARFLSRDPAGSKIRRPQSCNRYAYVENNPLRHNDPNGEDLKDAVEFAGGVIRGATASVTLGAWPGSEPQPTDSNASLAGQLVGSTLVAIEGAKGAAAGTGTAIATAPACATGAGCAVPIAAAGVAAAGTTAVVGATANMAKISDTAGSNSEAEPERDGSQDKKLSNGEIDALQDAGIDVHELKGGKGTGKTDLFKDQEGNVYVKPKSGEGAGEGTGVNIKDLKKN